MKLVKRKVGEGIIIEGDIDVSVLAINNNEVVIGITSPDDIMIEQDNDQQHYKEAYDRAADTIWSKDKLSG